MKFSLENFEFSEGVAASSNGVGAVNGASVDHAKGPCAAFIVNCGTFATSLVAKLQYSENDSDWTDEPDATAGNSVSEELTAEGQAVLYAPNPRGRYSRVVVTLGGTNVISVTNVVGPLRYVAE